MAAFAVATNNALLEFDSSVNVMEDLVDSYELARQRHTSPWLPLLFLLPKKFDGRDLQNRGLLIQAERTLADQVRQFSSSARECAGNLKAAQPCTHPQSLSVHQLPAIQRRAACMLSASEVNSEEGCKERVRIGSACRCMRCEFLSQAIKRLPGTTQTYTCASMPPGRQITTSFLGTVRIPTDRQQQDLNLAMVFYDVEGEVGKIED